MEPGLTVAGDTRPVVLRRPCAEGGVPESGSEKLVPAVTEFTSALTMQKTDVSSLVESFKTTSLEESVTATASPGTVPHNTIGRSLTSSPFSCQKFVAVSTESSSAERNVSSSEELFDATSPEGTVIATSPHKAVDGSSSFVPFSCEKLGEGVTESASVQTPQEPDVTSFGTFLDSTSSEELITASPQAEPCDQKLVAAAVESASMSSIHHQLHHLGLKF